MSPAIESVRASAYQVPTDRAEADGTAHWDSTTLMLVEIDAGGKTGLGYTYSAVSNVALIEGTLAGVIVGHPVFDIPARWDAMQRSVRNLGREGLAATAISAVDAALWDLKGKLLEQPVATLLGQARDAVPIYGSGGFTTYTDDELRDQLAGWVERDGCRWVKMKVGTHPDRDPHRVATARAAIGDRGFSSMPTAPIRRSRH